MLHLVVIFVYKTECMGNKRFAIIEERVNQTTGEFVTSRKSVSVETDSDKFFMTFISEMSSFYKINCLTDVKVLAALCSNAQFNSYTVLLPPSVRKTIMADCGINTQTMSNSMKRLKDLGLVSGADGEYHINPNIFWKGSTNERKKLLADKGLEINIKFTSKSVEEEIIKSENK